ncbi:MAG: 30S ribosomal protein S18 [Planctomycetota bacterium]
MARSRRVRSNRGTRCRFCRENIDSIDYKDIDRLSKLTTGEARMFSRKRSGNCAKHQRMFEKAVKRARFLALMPYE